MGSVSADNQPIPISGDEMVNFNAYSSAVHKVVVWVNTGIIGLLQLVNQQSSVLDTHNATFLCAFVFILLYIVLRVRETTERQLRPGLVPMLVGYTSHFFGGLAAIMLIFVVSAIFAKVLFLLWFLWLSAVVYTTLTEIVANRSIIVLPITALPQSVSDDKSIEQRRQQNIKNTTDSAQQNQKANPREPINNMQPNSVPAPYFPCNRSDFCTIHKTIRKELSSLQCNVQERQSQKAIELTSCTVMIV